MIYLMFSEEKLYQAEKKKQQIITKKYFYSNKSSGFEYKKIA